MPACDGFIEPLVSVMQPFETEVPDVGWIHASLFETKTDQLEFCIEIQTFWWDEYRLWTFIVYPEQVADGFCADYIKALVQMMEGGHIG